MGMKPQNNTSWQNVSSWYDKLVGSEGHYFHQHVIIPGLLRLLELNEKSSLVDLGCGQGILSRAVPVLSKYLGVDRSKSLIESAKKTTQNPNYSFIVKDVTRSIDSAKPEFSHAAIVLALQNMENPEGAIKNAASYLLTGGKLAIVLNHPAFRIPRQTGWGIDEKTKQQYRWVNRYSTPLKIPIDISPGQKNQKSAGQTTWSFHRSLQDYVSMLVKEGFVITALEEWSSDKESEGKAAKMENRARKEFPMFLTLIAKK